mmetsp:Transcript_10781/g.22825  ORF Transcript_10781/g.22825 Transcript_10781/m.22825 type:complete len:270 (+) Transcript_10781:886-1695(+)
MGSVGVLEDRRRRCLRRWRDCHCCDRSFSVPPALGWHRYSVCVRLHQPLDGVGLARGIDTDQVPEGSTGDPDAALADLDGILARAVVAIVVVVARSVLAGRLAGPLVAVPPAVSRPDRDRLQAGFQSRCRPWVIGESHRGTGKAEGFVFFRFGVFVVVTGVFEGKDHLPREGFGDLLVPPESFLPPAVVVGVGGVARIVGVCASMGGRHQHVHDNVNAWLRRRGFVIPCLRKGGQPPEGLGKRPPPKGFRRIVCARACIVVSAFAAAIP